MDKKIIVAFHIGRGGNYHNQGHKTYCGEKRIDEFTDDLFLRNRDLKGKFISPEFFHENGSPVGLSLDEYNSGIGRIDIDGDYDTTYTCLLSDCDDSELELIDNSSVYKSFQLITELEHILINQ